MAGKIRGSNKAKKALHQASYNKAQRAKEDHKAEQAERQAANDQYRDRAKYDRLIAKAETPAERKRLIAERDKDIPYRVRKREQSKARLAAKYSTED